MSRVRSERQRRIEKILSDNQSHPSSSECIELATYLATRSESDFDYVPAILDALSAPCDLSHLRSGAPCFPGQEKQLPLIPYAFARLSTTLQALHQAASSPQVKAYAKQFNCLLLERWETMMKWMMYILEVIINTGDTKSPFVRCLSNLLLAVVVQAKEDAVMEELSTRTSTMECVCLLLCCKGHHAEPSWYCDVPDKWGKVCRLLALFRACFTLPAGKAAMQRVLLCKDKHMRRAIARSLERRGEEMIYGRTGKTDIGLHYDGGTPENLFCLIGGVAQLVETPVLWRLFHSTRFLHTYAYAVHNISEMAEMAKISDEGFWTKFGQCASTLARCATRLAPNPRIALLQLMENGFFLRTMGRLMKYARTDTAVTEVLKGLQEILPYLYLRKVFKATDLRGEVKKWIQDGGDSRISLRAAALRRECTQLLIGASSDKFQVNMCSSIRHKPTGPLESKACSGCHSVFYCSGRCQEEDWRVHWKECKALRSLYRAARLDASWVSLRTKEDQLRALWYRINSRLAAPLDLKRVDSAAPNSAAVNPPGQPCPLTCRPDTSISSFDFFVSEKDKVGYARSSMKSWLTSKRASILSSFDPWTARIQEWVDDMEANMDTTVIVEGIFQTDSQHLMVVLVRAHYSRGAAEGERYTISNSIFAAAPL